MAAETQKNHKNLLELFTQKRPTLEKNVTEEKVLRIDQRTCWNFSRTF